MGFSLTFKCHEKWKQKEHRKNLRLEVPVANLGSCFMFVTLVFLSHPASSDLASGQKICGSSKRLFFFVPPLALGKGLNGLA